MKCAPRLLMASIFLLAVGVVSSLAQSTAPATDFDANSFAASGAVPQYDRLQPVDRTADPSLIQSANTNPGNSQSLNHNVENLAGVVSIPNFPGSFVTNGKTFNYVMMGNDPTIGHTTTIPTKIVAIDLQLQNADLQTYTTVPIGPFVQPTLNSPNFEETTYTSGEVLQFADAVQRAEFFNTMKQNWHTDLNPAVTDHVTVQIPRFINVRINGQVMKERTYFTGTAPDGSIFVELLSAYFNQIFLGPFVNNEINAGNYTTDAVNLALFPNLYLFSRYTATGRPSGCCVLGFHTYFFDPSVTPQPRWMFLYASWISPGLFDSQKSCEQSGSTCFEDVTAVSHEISETFNDPFVNNIVPRWQFPGEPGVCQGNLETGDPVEVLANATFPVTLKAKGTSFTYHPQTEALLQWFEEGATSDALLSAFSYPDVTALTASATPCPPGH
jgi:hypothetical protein